MAITTQAPNINERLQSTLSGLKEKISGVIAVFLLDLENADLLASYPQTESKPLDFIGIMCSNNLSTFESQAKDFNNQQFYITEMELLTQDQKIYVTRIAPTTLLCIVGDMRSFKTAFAKRLIEETIKGDINLVMDRMGFRK